MQPHCLKSCQVLLKRVVWLHGLLTLLPSCLASSFPFLLQELYQEGNALFEQGLLSIALPK
jgi:hypothetical protein